METINRQRESGQTVPATFNIAELWILQTVIRYDVPHADSMDWPPCSPTLSDKIAFAILRCFTDNAMTTEVPLTKQECIAISDTVNPAIPYGWQIHGDPCLCSERLGKMGPNCLNIQAFGWMVLLRTFSARYRLEYGINLTPLWPNVQRDLRAALFPHEAQTGESSLGADAAPPGGESASSDTREDRAPDPYPPEDLSWA